MVILVIKIDSSAKCIIMDWGMEYMLRGHQENGGARVMMMVMAVMMRSQQ